MADNAYGYLLLQDGNKLLLDTGGKIICQDQVQLTVPSAAFITAQAAKVRRIAGKLIIVSHYQQYGRIPSGQREIGGSLAWVAAQRFTASKPFNLSGIEVFMKGFTDNTSNIEISILNDTAGAPGSTVLGVGTALGPVEQTFKWLRINFNTPIALTGGTAYWIKVAVPSGATNNYFIATDALIAGEGICQAGVSGSMATIADTVLLTRLISGTEADNEQEINDLMSWRLTRSKKEPAQSFEAQLSNTDYKYSYGQSYSSYLEAGKIIKSYVGFEVNGLNIYCRAFYGETESNPCGSADATLKAKCLMNKLLSDKMTSEALGNMAYETMIQTVATHAGISVFDLRTTGKTSKSGITFQDLLSSSIAEQVRSATLDTLQFKNGSTLISAARAKSTAGPGSTVKYALNSSNFLIKDSIKVEISTEDMINRITVTNDENGETSTDGAALNVGDYQTIGTASGSLLASEQTKTITITLTEYASIYMEVSDAEVDCVLTETSRDCGDYNSYGSVVVSLLNKNYPSAAGDYNLTVKGCPISNAGAGTVLVEKINQGSIETYGKYSERIDNKIFANAVDAGAFATAVLDENAVPKEIIKASCRGMVDIYPDDILSFTDEKTKLDHVAIEETITLSYQNYPASFDMYIEARKLPFNLVGFMLLDSGGFLLREDGGKIKL